jgi:hypothetical protein
LIDVHILKDTHILKLNILGCDIELMGQGISDAARTSIKSQTLADFIAKWIGIQMPLAAVDEE